MYLLKKKRVIAVLLVFAMAMSLFGCSEEGEDFSTESDNSTRVVNASNTDETWAFFIGTYAEVT